jgi:hypothetical protein
MNNNQVSIEALNQCLEEFRPLFENYIDRIIAGDSFWGFLSKDKEPYDTFARIAYIALQSLNFLGFFPYFNRPKDSPITNEQVLRTIKSYINNRAFL